MYQFKKNRIAEALDVTALFAEGGEANNQCSDTGACDTNVNVGTCK